MLAIIDIVAWIIAIAAIVFGVICTIVVFTEGGWKIVLGIVSLVIGVVVFIAVYNWLESIGVCLFASGALMCLISTGCGEQEHSSGSGNTSSAPNQKGFIGTFADEAMEYYKIESAVEEAIRKSKE